MQSAPAPAPPPPPPPSEFVSRLAQIVPRIAAIAPHLKLFAPAKYDEYITYLHNNHPRNSSANQARKRTHSGSVAAESAKKLDTKETAAVETTVPAKLELPAKKDAAQQCLIHLRM
ncbi:hypothetical protein BCR33DRAFT_528497 [Rhizoclosmatium globosum]|uniref:Uncharacterized protein n=1 Tax=Rhizoclosmatium globosum TaxID=329046 RepID=A0A1Y2CTT0_9FUNG|nr:hypothetical protein BCR33DRAFT_528497 [Rhizoclosmatium globosum]|eukprot:ORY50392.1 hypothetical protein BCR33DRAFT_528497 [Rhizoclosmatium globosum]